MSTIIALTVTPIRDADIGDPIVFGLGVGTINVPILSFQETPRRPVRNTVPTLGSIPAVYRTGFTPRRVTITGNYGIPGALDNLQTVYENDSRVQLNRNNKYIENQWRILEFDNNEEDLLAGIARSVTYSVTFEDTEVLADLISGDAADQE